jgi:hypothetical protein
LLALRAETPLDEVSRELIGVDIARLTRELEREGLIEIRQRPGNEFVKAKVSAPGSFGSAAEGSEAGKFTEAQGTSNRSAQATRFVDVS